MVPEMLSAAMKLDSDAVALSRGGYPCGWIPLAEARSCLTT